MPERKVTDWEIEDHGVEHAQYFQGAGLAYTDFEDIATGVGMNALEAFDDAIDSLSVEWDVSEIVNQERPNIEREEGKKQIVDYITFNASWGENKANVESYVNTDIEYMEPPEDNFQTEVSENEAVLTFWGAIDEGAQRILDFCSENGIPMTSKSRRELKKLADYGLEHEMHYYLSIRVKGEEEAESFKNKAKRVANLAEKLIR